MATVKAGVWKEGPAAPITQLMREFNHKMKALGYTVSGVMVMTDDEQDGLLLPDGISLTTQLYIIDKIEEAARLARQILKGGPTITSK